MRTLIATMHFFVPLTNCLHFLTINLARDRVWRFRNTHNTLPPPASRNLTCRRDQSPFCCCSPRRHRSAWSRRHGTLSHCMRPVDGSGRVGGSLSSRRRDCGGDRLLRIQRGLRAHHSGKLLNRFFDPAMDLLTAFRKTRASIDRMISSALWSRRYANHSLRAGGMRNPPHLCMCEGLRAGQHAVLHLLAPCEAVVPAAAATFFTVTRKLEIEIERYRDERGERERERERERDR